MMKKKIACLVLATLLMLSSGCADKNVEKEKDVYRVLFIGNSYTHFNNMPDQLFRQIAENAGYQVKVSTVTKGAWTLEKFANPQDSFGALVAEELDPQFEQQYDYVVLQEQSFRPAGAEVALFYDAVRNLTERIRAVGAEPILYATWGYRTGHEILATEGLTTESMTWKLAAAYGAIGEETQTQVAYVGLAFRAADAAGPVQLYDEDCSHPTADGSYLAALTLACRIFGEEANTQWVKGLISEEYAEILCNAANEAVFQTPQIPKEYQTSSVGVTSAK